MVALGCTFNYLNNSCLKMKIIKLISVLLFVNCSLLSQENKAVEPIFNSLTSFPNVRDFTLSATGEEGYITVQSPLEEISVLVKITKSGNKWAEHTILPFSGKYKDLEPFLSKDNLRLYFASNRPKPDSTNVSKDFDIWYVERSSIDTEWGLPVNLGAPINTNHNEFYPSVSQQNNMYFTSDRPTSKGKDDIFCSTWNNNKYSEPFSLSESINSVGYEFNAYVSFDESYLIFSAYKRKDGFGSGDLYISFKDKNNKWSKAINMGKDINSKAMDYCPFINHNSTTMYFTSKRSSFKKVNNFQTIEEVIKEINKTGNGRSTVYKTSIDKLLRTIK